jgi:DNA-binding beta-propeller fold protein YncE
VIGSGNSIARIDPATGQVTHSAPVGSEPTALALAADASVLYVGLNGSGEVVRLALPSMAEQGRTRLPVSSFFGKSVAVAIAVSPADPGAAAVSMSQQFGTALLLNMAMQAKTTSSFKTNSLLAFDGAGATLYGLDTGSGELHVIQVLVDGLADQQSVATSAAGAQAFSFASNRLIAGRTLFDVPALTAAGVISGAADCVQQRGGSLLLCLAIQDFSTGQGRVLLADSGTFVIGASLLAATNEPYPANRRLVQGPAGQVAISYANSFFAPPIVRLFSSAQLP